MQLIDIQYIVADIKIKMDSLSLTMPSNIKYAEIKSHIYDKKTIGGIRKGYSFFYKKKWKRKRKTLADLYDTEGIFIKNLKHFFIRNLILDIKHCPYCGKNPLGYFDPCENTEYLSSKEKKKRTFQLDHFFPKSEYKDLGINLYNLVPSCSPCNHLKHERNPLEGGSSFHPYFGFINDTTKTTLDNEFFFSKYDRNNDNISKLDQNDKIKQDQHILKSNHGKKFHLDKIYLYSEDTFQIFNFIYDKYIKIKDEYHRFKEKSKNTDDFIEYFFSSYYPKTEKDILKYSNGKYKKDLIKHLRDFLVSEFNET